MTKWILVAGLVFLTTAAQAQQWSVLEQALSIKLSSEISAGIQCSAGSIAAQQALNQANARIKALEEKYEPKKPE